MSLEPSLFLGLAAFVLALFLLHRLASWMEARGWIYYRRGHGRSAAGNALLQAQAFLEPDRQHVLEVRQAEPQEEDAQGEPPDWPELSEPSGPPELSGLPRRTPREAP